MLEHRVEPIEVLVQVGLIENIHASAELVAEARALDLLQEEITNFLFRARDERQPQSLRR